MRDALFAVLSLSLLVLSILSFRDAWRYRAARVPAVITLQLPDGVKRAIRAVAEASWAGPAVVGTGLLCGFVVTLLDSLCTGQVYVPVLAMLARTTRVPALVPYSPYDAVSMVVDESIKDNPIFDVNGAQEMLNANATDDDVFLALAKHVPALSSPVGGKAVLGHNRDFDLNSDNYRNGWGRDHPTFKKSWLHSDMKDMAHFYVYKLYEQLVRKGNLK